MPISVFILNKISVTNSLNYKRSLISVCKYRIMRIIFKISPDRPSPRIGNHVTVFSSALGRHKIIIVVYFIHMRTFKIPSAGALPNAFAFSKLFSVSYIYLALNNSASAKTVCPVAHKIRPAVLKIQGRINTSLIDENRIGPFSVNIFRIYIKILAGSIVCSYHIESFAVKSYSRSENASAAVYFIQHNLIFAGKHMSDLIPVHKIAAFEKRHSRKILKAAAYHIIPSVCIAYAGIRIKSL